MTVLPSDAPIDPRTLSEARLLANVQARAERLFEDGYIARRTEPRRLSMTGPNGATYELDSTNRSCSCPFFTKHQGKYACKHLLGVGCLLKKQAEILRHNRREWEALT